MDWYICLHEWLIFMVHVGKYTIHGSYGIYIYLMASLKRTGSEEVRYWLAMSDFTYTWLAPVDSLVVGN